MRSLRKAGRRGEKEEYGDRLRYRGGGGNGISVLCSLFNGYCLYNAAKRFLSMQQSEIRKKCMDCAVITMRILHMKASYLLTT